MQSNLLCGGKVTKSKPRGRCDVQTRRGKIRRPPQIPRASGNGKSGQVCPGAPHFSPSHAPSISRSRGPLFLLRGQARRARAGFVLQRNPGYENMIGRSGAFLSKSTDTLHRTPLPHSPCHVLVVRELMGGARRRAGDRAAGAASLVPEERTSRGDDARWNGRRSQGCVTCQRVLGRNRTRARLGGSSSSGILAHGYAPASPLLTSRQGWRMGLFLFQGSEYCPYW